MERYIFKILSGYIYQKIVPWSSRIHCLQVYRGMLSDGQVVAIKRAQKGSMQGGHEFKTEIELLSRVHHKNLVGLVGFCFEQGEQMLVYEYMPNGTLRESLSGMLTSTTIVMQVSIENNIAGTLSKFLFKFFRPPAGISTPPQEIFV